MNKGVELLLERMETNPEEFMEPQDMYPSSNGKWDRILYELYQRVEQMDRDAGYPEDGTKATALRRHKPLAYLSDEEVLKLHTKLVETRAKMFNQTVMGILLGDSHDPREKSADAVYTAQATGAWGISPSRKRGI